MLEWFFGNEKAKALQIYNNGFTKKQYNGYEVYLIAKYAFMELKYGKIRVRKFVIRFCEDNDKNFNYFLLRNKIKQIIKNANSEWKDKTDSISITKSEIESIRKVKNFMAQKILLAFLVFAKKNNGYVYDNQLSDIKKIINISITEEQLKKLLHLAYKENLLRDSNENYFIKIIDNESPVVIELSTYKDLYNLTKIYKSYCGGTLEYCGNCGAEFIKRTSTHRYCDNCSNIKALQRYKKYNKNRKNA